MDWIKKVFGHISEYASNRVYSGKRPIPFARTKKRRESLTQEELQYLQDNWLDTYGGTKDSER